MLSFMGRGQGQLRPSKYCIFVSSPTRKSTLLYHTLFRSIAVVSTETASEQGFPSLDNLSEHDLSTLRREGLLVSNACDEYQLLEGVLGKEKRIVSILSVMVLPTMACNLSCRYCFQRGVAVSPPMSQETADRLIEWIGRRLSATGARELRLTLFGGEPLCNRPICHYLCHGVAEALRGTDVTAHYVIATNATLVNKADLELFSDLRFQCVQISLDGPKEIHERRRPARRGVSTYDIIRNNIRKISKLCQIALSVSFDSDNVQAILPFIEELAAESYSRTALLFFNPVQAPIRYRHDCSRFQMSNYDQAYWTALFYSRAWQLGFPRIRVFEQRDSLCVATRPNSFVVDPQGRIFKCGALVGEKEFEVGHVREAGLSPRNDELLALVPWKLCPDCPYVPLCGGGCRYMAWAYGGGYGNVFCDKDFFEVFVRSTLREYFLEEFERFEGSLSA